jgi:hypothetical protein
MTAVQRRSGAHRELAIDRKPQIKLRLFCFLRRIPHGDAYSGMTKSSSMNSYRSSLRSLLLAIALLASASPLFSADSPELEAARAKLLELFQNGKTDTDDQVKRQRAEIAALEYIATAKPPTLARVKFPLVNVDFPGGPASMLLAGINQDKNSGLNVIGEKSDLAVELPPFAIRNTDGHSLARALDNFLRQRGYTLQGGGTQNLDVSPVFVLRKLTAHETGPGGAMFQPFQLSAHLEQQSVDDIIGAIRAAWELDPANAPNALRLKFHPATGILLVSGPNHGIQLVGSILSQIRKKDGPMKANPNPKTEMPPPGPVIR